MDMALVLFASVHATRNDATLISDFFLTAHNWQVEWVQRYIWAVL